LFRRAVFYDLQEMRVAFAETVVAGPVRARATWKRLANAALKPRLAVRLEQGRVAFTAATRSEDFRAGVSAFLAKKPVTFKGR
jgi:2-(1,2-epoxy-1,2-dihydrophenyl)acetyl-CoA isomerase